MHVKIDKLFVSLLGFLLIQGGVGVALSLSWAFQGGYAMAFVSILGVVVLCLVKLLGIGDLEAWMDGINEREALPKRDYVDECWQEHEARESDLRQREAKE